MDQSAREAFNYPISAHQRYAATPSEIEALFTLIETGDTIRYNDRVEPVRVINAQAGVRELATDGTSILLETYNGRKHRVRARFNEGSTTEPITDLAIVARGSPPTDEYSIDDCKQRQTEGTLWEVSYHRPYNDESTAMLATGLKVFDCGVVGLYNHFQKLTPVWVPLDAINNIETLVVGVAIHPHTLTDITAGETVRITGCTETGEPYTVPGRVEHINDDPHPLLVLAETTGTHQRYMASVPEMGGYLRNMKSFGDLGELVAVIKSIQKV